MSYCLVCLASGTKDPCVRCGHRPSKRVEQLVHLRLKSIYKAFKQSGAGERGGGGGGNLLEGGGGSSSLNHDLSSSGARGNNNSGSNSGNNSHSSSTNNNNNNNTYRGKYSSALRSLTENESLRNMEGSSNTNFDQSMANEVAAVLQTASNSMSDGENGQRSRGRRVSSHPPPPFSASDPMKMSGRPRTSTSPLWRKTREEIEAANAAAEASAEAAAAALLAELDEEETNTGGGGGKKSKKKKKKKEKKKDHPPTEEVDLAEKKEVITSEDNIPTTTTSAKNPDIFINSKSAASNTKKQGTKAEYHQKSTSIDDDSSDEEEMILEQLVGMNKKPPKKEREKVDKKESQPTAAVEPTPPPPPAPAPAPAEGTAELDKELSLLISNNDEDGLEEFLANLKGVPGLSVLRKATKKALKKLKDDKYPSEKPHKGSGKTAAVDGKPSKKQAKQEKAAAATSSAQQLPLNNNLNPATTAGSQHGPLLRVVSRTHSAVGSTTKGGASCVMHMSPTVVGWVIGKGGQRIRDMMEESGAKIWIDQESMGDNDARVVYVSGKRSSVDMAVRMVKDLISKAPVSASAAVPVPVPVPGSTTPSSASTTASQPASAPVLAKSPSPVIIAPAPAPDPAPSFAAAASQGTKPSVPAAGPVSAPKLKKAPPAGWSTADNSTNAPQQPPKAVAVSVSKPVPQPTASIDESSKSIASMMSAGMQQPPPSIVRSTIDCDPQLILLLLGRDALAAKSIQTESGATLHINQSVAPGKIGVSGKAENVAKAEQLIHGVIKYREEQLRQEQAQKSAQISSIPRPDVALNPAADAYASEIRRRSENNATLPSMHRFQNQRPPQIPANRPPGYDAYSQRPSSFGASDENILHRQSPLQRHSPLPQPPRPSSASSFHERNIHSHHQDWSQLPQTQPPNQYSSISQYSSGQHMTRDSNYMGSNMYPSSSNPVPRPMPPMYSSGDQNRSYLQNLEAPRPASAAPQVSISDLLNQGNVMNGLGMGFNVNGGAAGGDNWSQNRSAPQAAHGSIPGFATQRSLPPEPTQSLSDNSFLNRLSAPGASHPPVRSNIDDSKFVDNMFNSLGDSNDNEGFLDLNSLSLGGLQQQSGASRHDNIGGLGGLFSNTDSNSRGTGFDFNFGNQ